ncbi:MAG TPA: transglutaminase domain-containing protein [Nanoarchaeota archaeon]|nr:transglutaminase domain-containing protein [Nanoarchaeota archaeon]
MGIETYLQTPTYGELFLVTLFNWDHPIPAVLPGCLWLLEHFIGNKAGEELKWPDDSQFKPMKTQNPQEAFRPIASYMSYSEAYREGKDGFVEHYKVLQPKATLKRKTGDCASYSVLAVSFLRQCRVPARFMLRHNDKHATVETLKEESWQWWEPQTCKELGHDAGEKEKHQIFSSYYDSVFKAVQTYINTI